MEAMEFGKRVRRLRLAKGWSVERLAREMKMSKETVLNIEFGKTSPKLNTINRIAAALAIDPGDLIQEEPISA